MIKMLERVLKYIREHQMLKEGDTVAVALSGGADSVCLLYIMAALAPVLGIRVSAVHVHHGIRKSADRDEAFVVKLCEENHIPLRVVHVNVPQTAAKLNMGIEETARKLRYEALGKDDAKYIALAHHSMDQAETVLLNLMRGSGLRGLAGMLPVHGRWLRPLLEETPETIRNWLCSREYVWVEDETNQDLDYRRNHVRHEMIPMLKTNYNPRLIQTLCATSSLLQEDEAALMEWTQAVYEKCKDEKGLCIRGLKQQPEAIRKRCFRRYLQETAGLQDISRVHIEAIDALMDQQSGHRVPLPRGWEIQKEYDHLYIASAQKEKTVKNPLEWRPEAVPGHVRIEPFERILKFDFVENMENNSFSEKGYTKCFDYDTIKGTLAVRTRRPGDYLTMAGGRKKLKEYFIDNKVPSSERDQVLLLADGSHILWVIGYRMSDACKIGPDTKRILQVQCWNMNTYEGMERPDD